MKRNYAFEVIKFLSAIVIAVLHYNYLLVPQGYLCVVNGKKCVPCIMEEIFI